jgi:hypothetical protein
VVNPIKSDLTTTIISSEIINGFIDEQKNVMAHPLTISLPPQAIINR